MGINKFGVVFVLYTTIQTNKFRFSKFAACLEETVGTEREKGASAEKEATDLHIWVIFHLCCCWPVGREKALLGTFE